MAIKTTEQTKTIGKNTIVYGFAFDEEKPNDKKLIFEIHKNKKIIEFYPYKSQYYFFEKVILTGFSQLPDFLKRNGYSKNRILDYINKTFKNKRIKSLTINRSGKTDLMKRGANKHLYLNYQSVNQLCNELGSANFHHSRRKTFMVNKHFASDLPKLIKVKSTQNPQDQINQALQLLSIQNEKDFDKNDVNRITNILTSLMKFGYKSQITKSRLFKNTKLHFDVVTLDEIIKDFEQKLKKKMAESKWGNFLENNLFLIDSKYIHAIPQLNLVLGGSRKVDFGLIDTHGYLDLFEIKKPETKLLTTKKDSRGNYVWDKQALEAIVQAEKYLLHADNKRNDLRSDIKREKNIILDVIRPRAFVIMGNSIQLDNDDKKEDFRMLKNQFKNIEIILYDELLDRIKNQKKSIE